MHLAWAFQLNLAGDYMGGRLHGFEEAWEVKG